jgi:hypothetical protein
MRVIHFTKHAADPLEFSGASGASFLPLADGEGDTHLSCLHLEMGGKIKAPSIIHAAALLAVCVLRSMSGDHSDRCRPGGVTRVNRHYRGLFLRWEGELRWAREVTRAQDS